MSQQKDPVFQSKEELFGPAHWKLMTNLIFQKNLIGSLKNLAVNKNI